jgi:hypothetical protein
MKVLVSLFLLSAVMMAGFTNESAFFIPIPSAFAPVTRFGCPDAGTVFTYHVPAWNTNRPNRMVAIKQDQLNCRIRSDAWGVYDWFGGLAGRLDDADVAERKMITDLWPLRTGYVGKSASTVFLRSLVK